MEEDAIDNGVQAVCFYAKVFNIDAEALKEVFEFWDTMIAVFFMHSFICYTPMSSFDYIRKLSVVISNDVTDADALVTRTEILCNTILKRIW